MSVKRFSLNAQRVSEPSDYDHMIVLKDNTTPPPTTLSRTTTNNFSDTMSTSTSAGVSRVQSLSSMQDRGVISPVGTGTGSTFGQSSVTSSSAGFVPGHKRKESLRKHLAERKYQRNWKQKQNNANGIGSLKSSPEASGDSTSDSESDVSNVNGKDGRRRRRDKGKARDFPQAVLSKKDEIQNRGTRALRKARQVGRQVRKEELVDDAGELDILYENQRGTFFFGIPMFSAKSLLPVDSAPWTNRHHAPSAVNIFTAQVPDPSWIWAWKSFAVDMTGDVDEEGWQYSFAFRGSRWHGNAVWWHGFVRRRRWIRKRVKLKVLRNPEDSHSLAPDYFTIHSQTNNIQQPRGYYTSSVRSGERNSKLEEYPTAIYESTDSELEEFEIQDIPSLMKAFKRARLDREKIEALSSFLIHGGPEVLYLAESMPKMMKSMIFQQSRRKILSILLDTMEKANDSRREREKKAAEGSLNEEEQEAFDDANEKRFIDGLGRAVEAGELEVRKLEYWSDIKAVQHQGYAGIENTPEYGKDHDSSDYEYADIWKARGRIMTKRKEQMAGKARGDWGERDETDRSTLASRGTDGGESLTTQDKGKARATE